MLKIVVRNCDDVLLADSASSCSSLYLHKAEKTVEVVVLSYVHMEQL